MSDVAVIGGGVIGLAIAWRAAAAGMSVVLADPSPGSGASHVSAGMLAPVSEAHFGEPELLALGLASWRRYPAFVAELEEASDASTGYMQCGSLLVARDADDNVALERDYRYRVRLGLDVERLSAAECRALEPRLAPSVRGGVYAAADHQIDPRLLVRCLETACSRAGVRMVGERAALAADSSRATGIRVGATEVPADRVVLAAGCWTATVEGLPAAALPPVRPVKGQILRLHAGAAGPLVQHVIRSIDVYAVPRADGHLVVGASLEERGFDTTVTAGAVHQLLRDARELLPDIAELELREVSAGLRPATPDNAPLIGATEVRGLFMAAGHYRNGILFTPVTADAILAEMQGQATVPEAAPFSPRRFEPAAAVLA